MLRGIPQHLTVPVKCCDRNSHVCEHLQRDLCKHLSCTAATCAELPHLELCHILPDDVAWCSTDGPQWTRQHFGVLSLQLNCLSRIYVECGCPGTFVDLGPESLEMYRYKLIIIHKRVYISGAEGNCPFSSFLPFHLITTAQTILKLWQLQLRCSKHSFVNSNSS